MVPGANWEIPGIRLEGVRQRDGTLGKSCGTDQTPGCVCLDTTPSYRFETERRANPAGRIKGEFRAPLPIQVRVPVGLGTERPVVSVWIQSHPPTDSRRNVGQILRDGSRQFRALSLGRVDPAPHTRHLQGLFAPSTQNSSLRSLSKVDSVPQAVLLWGLRRACNSGDGGSGLAG